MLLAPQSQSQWKGFPIAWIEASPHLVHAELTTERTGLVMIDSGSTRADFLYGAKAMDREFTAGSIGLFASGTELKRSRWQWTKTRRIYVDLEAALPGGNGLLEPFQDMPRRTEIEFRDPEITAVLRIMVNEIANGCPHGQLYAESLSLGIAMRLRERAVSGNGGSKERGKLAPADLKRVQEFIDTRLAREISLSALAAAAGFSAAQFVRLFKNTLGCTPHQYVLRRRVKHARELVITTELPLTVIAASAGFANQSHMTSAFVRAYATPPGQMRRRTRTNGTQWE